MPSNTNDLLGRGERIVAAVFAVGMALLPVIVVAGIILYNVVSFLLFLLK